MIKTLIGITLFILPFLYIFQFENKRSVFFKLLTLSLTFQLVSALIFQLFEIFNYASVVISNLLFCCYFLYKTNFKNFNKNIFSAKLDWTFILLILVVFTSLYSIHHNYTGEVSTILSSKTSVEHQNYPFPYYSDEWIGVSLIKYCIESGKLPFVNPLWFDFSFPNLEFAFHSFLSQIFVLFDASPLMNYVDISLIFNLYLCFLVYFILRFNGLEKIPSFLAAASIPYITSGGNLPGIYHLLPITLGVIFLLQSLIFFSVINTKFFFLNLFLSLCFYPPLILFILPIFIIYVFKNKSSRKERRKILIYFSLTSFLIVLIVLSYLFIKNRNIDLLFSFILSRLFYPSFTQGITDYKIYKIIPIFSLFFAGVGFFINLKEKLWLKLPIFVGLFYWALYSRVLWRFIIEYQRNIFVCSIFLILLSGFGLNYFFDYLQKKEFLKKYYFVQIIKFILVLSFVILSFQYTSLSDWQDLKLHSTQGEIMLPSAPATEYLTKEDLVIFENITKKVFIAPPWKALVIGSATGNYPIETKQSTISNSYDSYKKFISLSCDQKRKFSIKWNLSYVYSSSFSCEKFTEISSSKEKLFLYKFKK